LKQVDNKQTLAVTEAKLSINPWTSIF